MTAVEAPTETPRETPLALAVGDNARGSIEAFASSANYELAKRMAIALSQGTMVPTAYIGSPSNCLIALELASRTGASVLMVMQNMFVIEGRPSWSATFLIASVNSCGRFSPLRFVMKGEPGKSGWSCFAVARDLTSGEVLEGEPVTWDMAKAEGWVDRRGSKWRTMPGQMMRYRAASFWTRIFSPEISLGMHTADEIEDVVGSASTVRASAATASLNTALAEVIEETQSGVCPICGLSDGRHDPDYACYSDE